jgi:hypothetical protein
MLFDGELLVSPCSGHMVLVGCWQQRMQGYLLEKAATARPSVVLASVMLLSEAIHHLQEICT